MTPTLCVPPSQCPSCGEDLVRAGEYLVCLNVGVCPAQVVGALERWVQKIGILDWGSTALEALVEAGHVKEIADLYLLDRQTLASLQLAGRVLGSSADVMLANLHAKKELPLHTLVGSLGIPLMGRSNVKMLIESGYDTFDKLLAAKPIDIAKIDRMGDTKAVSFVRGIAKRKGAIDKLLAAGVTIKAAGQGVMKGKSVCLTGFRDAALEERVENQGGSIKSSVGRDLSYLVAKDPTSTSGKAQKARDLGIQVIGIEDMWNLLGGRS